MLQSEVTDRDERGAAPVAELAIIVPNHNERANVCELVARLRRVLLGTFEWEVAFVDDDSADGTAEEVRRLALGDPRIRLVKRAGRRRLSSACVDGMLATVTPYLAMLDGDLQHDERLLGAMLELRRRREAKLVVGSRYADSGGVGNWSGRRRALSGVPTRLARRLLPVLLSDPMSGFFMLRRELLEERVRRLTCAGFKLLFDVVTASDRPVRVVELPYRFRSGHAGESKLDARVAWDFLLLLATRATAGIRPTRFLAFVTVGAFSVVVDFACLAIAFRAFQGRCVAAQAIGTPMAVVSNYALNNVLTFRDRRRTGVRWLTGLGAFFLWSVRLGWWRTSGSQLTFSLATAASPVAGLSRVLVRAVWNHAVTGAYVWGDRCGGA